MKRKKCRWFLNVALMKIGDCQQNKLLLFSKNIRKIYIVEKCPKNASND